MERSADWMDQARGDLEHARSDTDAYALVKRALNIRRLEPHVYAEEEYQ